MQQVPSPHVWGEGQGEGLHIFKPLILSFSPSGEKGLRTHIPAFHSEDISQLAAGFPEFPLPGEPTKWVV